MVFCFTEKHFKTYIFNEKQKFNLNVLLKIKLNFVNPPNDFWRRLKLVAAQQIS